jgi:hypothetical protein
VRAVVAAALGSSRKNPAGGSYHYSSSNSGSGSIGGAEQGILSATTKQRYTKGDSDGIDLDIGMTTGIDKHKLISPSIGRRKRRLRLPLQLRDITLLHRLWEAHFLPSQLTICLLFSSIYAAKVPAAAIHPTLAWAFWFTGVLRTASFIGMNIGLTLYDGWHTLCVTARARDMARAGIPGTGFAFRAGWWHPRSLAERLIFPLAGTLFGSVPAVHAELSHFWTDRLVYRVSQKPVFAALAADGERAFPT